MESLNILTPVLPESVSDALVVRWHKAVGDFVEQDEVLVDIETDKVVLEVPALESGILMEIKESEGQTVVSSQVLGILQKKEKALEKPTEVTPQTFKATSANNALSPSMRRKLAACDLSPQDLDSVQIKVNDRTTCEDLKTALATSVHQPIENIQPRIQEENQRDTRTPMSRLRQRIADRLVDVNQQTAMLTTINEVNMQPIKDLRKNYGEAFEKKYGVRLGFMSFYVKAVVEALKRYPAINASIDGTDIVQHHYYDISIAVSTPRGLVTPVVRDCDKKTMAEIEQEIKTLAQKGREGKLTIEELTGGVFTITNGGVFGSLLSTPMINPPQAAILGMHNIQERPIAFNGEVVIRPMMYVALSYDHRLVDGKDSVGFLVTVKECLEDPARMLLNI